MAKTAIEWTQHRWNPIVGCTIVSPGCSNCYAMAIAERFRHVYQGRPFAGTPAEAMTRKVNGKPVWTGQLTLAPERTLTEPLRRRRPTTWFVNSMGDLFHEAVPDEWIDKVFAVMALAELLHRCPPEAGGRDKHVFQVLTKRADRMRHYVGNLPNRDDIVADAADQLMGGELPVGLLVAVKRLMRMPLPSVWLGVSAEDQRRADERIPDLLATPAAVRFVSAEPLLGPIDFNLIWLRRDGQRTTELSQKLGDYVRPLHGNFRDSPKLDWIIVGGESGREARPMHPDWARQIRDQCAAAGTAFFFKQWGEWKDGSDFAPDYKVVTADGRITEPDIESLRQAAREQSIAGLHPTAMRKVGKKRAGRLLDGVQHNAMPEARR